MKKLIIAIAIITIATISSHFYLKKIAPIVFFTEGQTLTYQTTNDIWCTSFNWKMKKIPRPAISTVTVRVNDCQKILAFR